MPSLYYKDSPESIQELFNSIASRYDRANSLMSFHMHALWNNQLAKTLLQKRQGGAFLDLCAGTGEIAFRAYALAKKTGLEVAAFHLVDFSSEMLKQAKGYSKMLPENDQKEFFFHTHDVTELPFAENSFTAAAIAYGIRNVQNMAQCFSEVYRVLQPGGWFGIVELTRPKNPVLKIAHSAYLRTVLPCIGRLFCKNKAAYTYLSTSIEHFVAPEVLASLLAEKGFVSISTKSLFGGVATLIIAQKGAA